MDEVLLHVTDLPPTKNEAKSMLALGHGQASRVLALLRVARDATASERMQPVFGNRAVGLDLVVRAPTQPPSDATNYLGGVGDVLEGKSHRGALDHLGDLASVAIFANDRQIQRIHYRWEISPEFDYSVRVWRL